MVGESKYDGSAPPGVLYALAVFAAGVCGKAVVVDCGEEANATWRIGIGASIVVTSAIGELKLRNSLGLRLCLGVTLELHALEASVLQVKAFGSIDLRLR